MIRHFCGPVGALPPAVRAVVRNLRDRLPAFALRGEIVREVLVTTCCANCTPRGLLRRAGFAPVANTNTWRWVPSAN